MESRPLYPTILHEQGTHRSPLAWIGVDSKELYCRCCETIFHHTSVLDGHIIPLLQQAGFYGVARLGFVSLDLHLITSFVERWRPKTHTFHLGGVHDYTIGHCHSFWTTSRWSCSYWQHMFRLEVCMLFSIKTHCWRHKHIWAMPSSYMDEKSIQRYTRAYILQLIGGFLFLGKSSDKVHLMFLPLLEDFEVVGRYSWGSVCLAWLY